MRKKLIRSQSDKMIGGVSGGLAEYFDIDSNIIRLIFIALTLFGGTGVLIYLVLWLILPEENKTSYFEDIISTRKKKGNERMRAAASRFASEVKDTVRPERRRDGTNIFAIILIFFGLIFLLNNFISVSYLFRLWPLILVVIGLSIIFSNAERK